LSTERPNSDDYETLRSLVVAGMGLIEAFDERLIATRPSDLDDWSVNFPASFEVQVFQLAIPCCDFMQWGLQASLVRYSGVAGVSTRFLAETLALIRWLSEPGDARSRQERSFRYLKQELNRTKSKLYERQLGRESSPGVRNQLSKILADMEATIDSLWETAEGLGFSELTQPPKRDEMLDDVLKLEGGYSLFAITSEFSGHPGFLMLAPFRGNIDLSGQVLQRLFWVTTQIELLARLVQATGEALHWGSWFDESFLPLLNQVEPFRARARRRFNEEYG
jgi:hypothetical protein